MNSLQLRYNFLHIFYFFSICSVNGFTAVFLQNKGMSNTLVGLAMGLGSTLSIAAAPVLSSVLENIKGITIKKLILIVYSVQFAVYLSMAFLNLPVWIILPVYMVMMSSVIAVTPLLSMICMNYASKGYDIDFGTARGLGSLGSAAAAYLVGLRARRSGAVTVPVCMAAGFGFMVLSVVGYGAVEKTEAVEKKASGGGFLPRYPRYAAVLVGLVLIFVSHVVLNSFTYQIVESKGGGSEQMGTAMAFASLIELPIMFLFGWMLKKVKCHVWFRIAGVFFFLKCPGTLLCRDIPGFYAVQLFQMFGWALMTVSAVFYINAIMAPEDSVKGQAFYTMSMTLGNVLGAIVAGRILDALGVQAMLVFGTVSALVGAVIVLVFTQRTKV